MAKKGKDNDLNEKILKLCLCNAIEDSNLTIQFIDTRIKFYTTLIEQLEDNKPFFFQKKKLIEYNNKLEEYNDKISDLYRQMGEETELIIKMHEQL